MSLEIKEHGIYRRRDGVVVGTVTKNTRDCGEDGKNYPWIVGAVSYRPNGREWNWSEGLFDLVEEIVVGEGWKPWNNGGAYPAGHGLIEAIYDVPGGFDRDTRPAKDWEWNAKLSPIVAYRLVEQQLQAEAPDFRFPTQTLVDNDWLEKAREAMRVGGERPVRDDTRGIIAKMAERTKGVPLVDALSEQSEAPYLRDVHGEARVTDSDIDPMFGTTVPTRGGIEDQVIKLCDKIKEMGECIEAQSDTIERRDQTIASLKGDVKAKQKCIAMLAEANFKLNAEKSERRDQTIARLDDIFNMDDL